MNHHLTLSPLAICLATALGAGSALAIAAPRIPLPIAGAARGSTERVMHHGHPELVDLRHFDASRVNDASLVQSRVTVGDTLRYPPLHQRIPDASGPNGVGRPNAHRRVPIGHPASASSGTVLVTNCNIDGPGSLNNAIESAGNDAIIDMTQLTCDEIFTINALVVNQDRLTLKGPGADHLSISNFASNGVLFHYGHDEYVCDRYQFPLGCQYGHIVDAELSIQGLTIADGTRFESNTAAAGGCVYSTADVELRDSVITGCHINVAGSASYPSKGGGVFAGDDLRMYDSKITNCYIAARSGLRARGGGAYVVGDLHMEQSSIDHNTAELYSVAGGAWVQGSYGVGSYINRSSISNNFAYAVGGLLFGRLPGYGPEYSQDFFYPPVRITNSTIGSNEAAQFIGGIKTYALLSFYSSTIAHNAAGLHDFAGGYIDSGVFFDNSATNTTCNAHGCTDHVVNGIDAWSTIIAHNEADAEPADINGVEGVVYGGHNLIKAAHVSVPSDTIVGVLAFLGPLALHGGSTDSFSLRVGSPAIDGGNGGGDGAYDQRGAGFPRESGTASDIGAFEAQQAQLIVDPSTVEFGTVSVGGSANVTFTISNGGDLPFQLLTFVLPSAPFQYIAGTCPAVPFTIYGRESCTVVYSFSPQSLGEFSQTLGYTSNATNADANGQIMLHGTGINDRIFADSFDP